MTYTRKIRISFSTDDEKIPPRLPKDIINRIGDLADTTSFSHYSRARKDIHGLFKSKLTHHSFAKQLLESVMNGDPDASEKLLQKLQLTDPTTSFVILKTLGKEKNGRS